MPNGDFEPVYSTNNIWYDDFTEECLTSHLEDMQTSIDTLQTGKANINHEHNGYAVINHVHSEYAPINHSHAGYAASTHSHSYNDLTDTPVIPTTLPANGGNSDTVDGKHAADFATAESVDMLQTLVGSTSVQSQISTAISAVTPTSIGAAEENHVHNYNDLINKPTSLPANGGNADTVAGKHVSDFATAESMVAIETLVGNTSVQSQISNAIDNHTHSYNNLTDKPTSLPANGGNADTVDNKHASDFATVESVDTLQISKANVNHTHNEYALIDHEHSDYVTEQYVNNALNEKISVPSIASVGQIIRVKTIDANGKPIEWETVNVTPDWDEQNEDAPGYIKNKPPLSGIEIISHNGNQTKICGVLSSTITYHEALDLLNNNNLFLTYLYKKVLGWRLNQYTASGVANQYTMTIGTFSSTAEPCVETNTSLPFSFKPSGTGTSTGTSS